MDKLVKVTIEEWESIFILAPMVYKESRKKWFNKIDVAKTLEIDPKKYNELLKEHNGKTTVLNCTSFKKRKDAKGMVKELEPYVLMANIKIGVI